MQSSETTEASSGTCGRQAFGCQSSMAPFRLLAKFREASPPPWGQTRRRILATPVLHDAPEDASMNRLSFMLIALLAALPALGQDAAPKVEDAKLGATRNVHRAGSLLFGGQFSREDIAVLKKAGVTRVITLRTPGEADWEAEALKSAKIGFEQIAVGGPDTLTDDVFDRLRRSLRTRTKGQTLLHCGSANRVGGAWLAYRVLDQGVALETAAAEAKTIGLRTPGYETKARAYIAKTLEKQGGKRSVKPGINDSFTDAELDVDSFVKRFEVEAREIFSSRKAILDAVGLKSGDAIADVGAGTGLFTIDFARRVGPGGWVYAVDIAPRFLERINALTLEEKTPNVSSVLCTETDVRLAPSSVDVVFICDTYHHFEFPQLSMASILRALKPGGRLVLIDFERIPGTSRPWILGHVRAGKPVFRAEIEEAGFRFLEEIDVKGLVENYCIVFERPEAK